ncbi:hypothetical protein FOZ63_006884, partial [Perkinsus olseni]
MQASELCREVEFHDSRAAEAFRNAVKVLEGGGGGAESSSFPVSREEAPPQPPPPPRPPPLRTAAAGLAAVRAEQQQQQPPTTTTPLPTMPTEPLISARTEPGGGGDGLLTTTTTTGVLQQQPPSPRPTTTTPWGERSATTPPAPRYLTSQVARSLARFYRAVGVSDYRGARVPSSASLTAIQATVPSPRAAAAATSPVVSVPGMEESLHITEVEGGLANRTTVMVRNIPPAYTSSRLLQEILETLLEQAGEDELAAINAAVGAPFGIDFVYLPFNLKNRAGVSYGFVNLTTTEELLIFHERFNQHIWRSGTSRAHNGGERRPCEMSAARLQGQQALIEAFVNRLHAKSEHIPLQARPLIYDPRVVLSAASSSSSSAA